MAARECFHADSAWHAKHTYLKHHDAKIIAGVKPLLIGIYTTTPNAHHVHAAFRRRLHETSMHSRLIATLQRLHGDHVPTARHDGRSIDAEHDSVVAVTLA